MHVELVWQGETTEVDLADGVATIGGAEQDHVRLAGMPEALLELTVEQTSLTVVTRRPTTIGAARFPPHVPRLLLEGDAVTIDALVLRRPAVPAQKRQRVDTAFVAKALLQGTLSSMAETRAATLTCVAGIDSGATFTLAFTKTVIGRAERVDIRLHDRSVSRHHTTLSRRNGHFLVERGSATNGVYVNGRAVKGSTRLISGDVLELGQTVLRFDGPEHPTEDRTVIVPNEIAPTIEVPKRTRENWLLAVGAALALIGIAITVFAATG